MSSTKGFFFFQDLHNEETIDHIERTPIHGHTSADNADIIGTHKDERVKGKWLQLPQLIINCYVKFRYGLLWWVEQKAKILSTIIRYSRTVERSWISNNLSVKVASGSNLIEQQMAKERQNSFNNYNFHNNSWQTMPLPTSAAKMKIQVDFILIDCLEFLWSTNSFESIFL